MSCSVKVGKRARETHTYRDRQRERERERERDETENKAARRYILYRTFYPNNFFVNALSGCACLPQISLVLSTYTQGGTARLS